MKYSVICVNVALRELEKHFPCYELSAKLIDEGKLSLSYDLLRPVCLADIL